MMTSRDLTIDPTSARTEQARAEQARTDQQAAFVRLIQTRHQEMDRTLPEWARRSNPIVRRHLGSYWKTIAPDFTQIGRWLALQSVFVALAIPFPFLLTLLMPAVTVSLFLLPIALAIYGMSLFNVGTMAAESVAGERRNHTLDVLRVAPRPIHHILLSKMAAAVWRQIEDLNLVIVGVALLTAPVLIVEYGILFNAVAQPWLTVIGVVLGMVVCVARLLLEPIMVSSLGVLMGATTPSLRMSAGTLTIITSIGYFIMINLPRLLPMEYLPRLLVETALPLIAPLIITWISIRIASWSLSRD